MIISDNVTANAHHNLEIERKFQQGKATSHNRSAIGFRVWQDADAP